MIFSLEMSSNGLPDFAQKLLDPIAKDNGFNDYSVQIKCGSQAGDGFASEIFSITITENNSDKRLDLVCKIAPQNKNYRKEFMSELLFSREALLYDRLLPIFEKFQNERNVPITDQFHSYPKCFGTVADMENEQFAIILEDLRPKGFKLWSKVKTSPIENVRLAMQELGKFHGLSIALKDQKPEVFDEFKGATDLLKIFFQSKNSQIMFNNSYDRAINSLKNEDHKNIVRHIKSNLMAYLDSCMTGGDSDEFCVLGHGKFQFGFHE